MLFKNKLDYSLVDIAFDHLNKVIDHQALFLLGKFDPEILLVAEILFVDIIPFDLEMLDCTLLIIMGILLHTSLVVDIASDTFVVVMGS